jgi:hypothetical protein
MLTHHITQSEDFHQSADTAATSITGVTHYKTRGQEDAFCCWIANRRKADTRQVVRGSNDSDSTLSVLVLPVPAKSALKTTA